MYKLIDGDTRTMIIADNQSWDKDTIKEMNKNGIYLDGRIGVMIHPQNNLIIIGSEDDGTLSFNKNEFGSYAMYFNAYWIDGLINSLQKVKERLKK